MWAVNSVIVSGRVAQDPIVRTTSTGKVVANVVIAHNPCRSSKGTEPEAVFIDITLWERSAEIVKQYVHKGDAVIVSGELSCEQWQAGDGSRRKKFVIIGRSIQIVSSPINRNSPNGQEPPNAGIASQPRFTADDHPPTRSGNISGAVIDTDTIPF